MSLGRGARHLYLRTIRHKRIQSAPLPMHNCTSNINGKMAPAIAAQIMDLTKDLNESLSLNKSPSAINILEFIRTFMVIDDGQIHERTK